jgi:hypothetical protein
LTSGSTEVIVPLTHRSRVLPVVEPNPLLARYTAEIIDEPKDDAAEDQSDFEKGGDQLDLAVDADEEDVGQEGQDCESAQANQTSGFSSQRRTDTNRDPDTGIEVTPVAHDCRSAMPSFVLALSY